MILLFAEVCYAQSNSILTQQNVEYRKNMKMNGLKHSK